jgi:hypothetical protein
VAVVEANLYNNCIIKAFIEHPAKRIRNFTGERIGEKWRRRRGEGDVDDHRQAGRMTSKGALSEAIAF